MTEIDAPEPGIVDLYTRASAFFGEQVIAIGDEEWDLPTPSGDWIVKAVVAHVVVAEAQMPDVARGRPFERFDVDVSILGHDPVSVWRGTAVNALQAIAGADLDQMVDHPVGTMPLRHIVGFRITENLVHGWDIAMAATSTSTSTPKLRRGRWTSGCPWPISSPARACSARWSSPLMTNPGPGCWPCWDGTGPVDGHGPAPRPHHAAPTSVQSFGVTSALSPVAIRP